MTASPSTNPDVSYLLRTTGIEEENLMYRLIQTCGNPFLTDIQTLEQVVLLRQRADFARGDILTKPWNPTPVFPEHEHWRGKDNAVDLLRSVVGKPILATKYKELSELSEGDTKTPETVMDRLEANVLLYKIYQVLTSPKLDEEQTNMIIRDLRGLPFASLKAKWEPIVELQAGKTVLEHTPDEKPLTKAYLREVKQQVGGRIGKKSVSYNGKAYALREGKADAKKYIVVKKEKVFLSDIRGRYRYV